MKNASDLSYVRFSLEADVAYLAPLLREIDIKELTLMSFSDPIAALSTGLEESAVCCTALSPATRLPMAMFGVVLTEDKYHTVWLLGTDEIKQHGRKFLKYSTRWVDLFVKQYGPIGNAVLAGNSISIAWLEWTGFTPIFSFPRGDDETFIYYGRDE